MEKKKNIKKKFIQGAIVLVFALMALGSSSMNNMSEQEAYDVGYGAGTLLRNIAK